MAIRSKVPSTRTLLDSVPQLVDASASPPVSSAWNVLSSRDMCLDGLPLTSNSSSRPGDAILSTLLIQKPNLGRWPEMSEVLAPFLVDSAHYIVKEDTSIYGGLYRISGYGIRSSLDEVLATAEKCTGGAFMTFVGNTTALIPFTVEGAEGQKYAIFDSHARSATGALDETGTSMLTYHDTLADVAAHYCAYARQVGQVNCDFMLNCMAVNVCALSSSSSEQKTNSQEDQCLIEDVSSPARYVSSLENEDIPFITPLPVRTLRMDEESPPEKLASSLTYEMIQSPITDVAPQIPGSTRTSR